MAIQDVLTAGLTKSLTVGGPGGGNNSPFNATVKCGNVNKVFHLVTELVIGTATEGTHVTGGRTVNVGSVGTTGNCYWLPWNAWRAYIGQLHGACNYFLTPNLTGCGFFVSGTITDPFVVHANCAAGEVVDFPVSGSAQEYNDDLEAARMQYYGQVAAELVANNYIPSVGLQMLRPDDYGKRAKDGFAVPTSVFGVRTGGNWAIYYNVGGSGGKGITKMLFPTFQSL